MGLVSYKQAAEQLGVSVNTVRRLVAAGDLRRIEVRTAVRVDQADVHAYIRRQKGEHGEADHGITDGQRRAFHAKVGEIARAQRADKATIRALALERVGRPVESVNDLTRAEASQALDWLEETLAVVVA